MLSARDLIEILDYNPISGELIWKFRPRELFNNNREFSRWNSRYANSPALASLDAYGYRTGRIDGKGYKAHRVVWAMAHGDWPNQIDHVNGDRTDNRLVNLRDVSVVCNNKNQKLRDDNSTGHPGVGYHRATKKWYAQIGGGTARVHLGVFDTIAQAIQARSIHEHELGYHRNHGRKFHNRPDNA